MHSYSENKRRKLPLQHTIAMHDNYAIANVEIDQSNILKIDSVLHPIVPVSPLLTHGSDVSNEDEDDKEILGFYWEHSHQKKVCFQIVQYSAPYLIS